MVKITKEYLLEYLEEKLKIQEDEELSLVKLVEELYDLNKNVVIPLDEQETFLFRKKYGIYDNGISQTREYISKEYNIGYQKYINIFERIYIKLLFRIKRIDKYERIPKINTLFTEDIELINKPISTFNIEIKTKNKLMKNFILTFKDLMEYSINELKIILGAKELKELIDYVHLLGFKFIDELSKDEKQTLINMSNKDIVCNSSIYLIDGVEQISFDRLQRNNIVDIKSLVKNVFILPTDKRIQITQFIVENDLSYLKNEKESKII